MQYLAKPWIAGLLLGWVGLACNKEPPPAAEQPKSPSSPQAASGAVGEAKARHDEANFTLEVVPQGEYQAGKAAEVAVVLSAKAPFKCNDKYPYKLKLEESDGVTLASKIVKKDAVKLETHKATMTVPFTPDKAGTRRLAGEFSFSVCTEDKCLIEKRKLALDVTVK